MTVLRRLALAAASVVVLLGAASSRLIVRPGRNPAWSDPKRDQGLDFEDVTFPSQDGVALHGWFIPRAGGGVGPTLVMLHGWPWSRMGTRATSKLNDLPRSKPVSLLPLAKAFHDAGYHVLMYDASGFGTSGRRGVYTSGWLEARDTLGALTWLDGRAEVDQDRIGAIGFSMGGATLTFVLPQTDRIKAAISVQPTTPAVFTPRYGRDLLGPLHALTAPVTELCYRLAGGPTLRFIRPAMAAVGCRAPILFVQSRGDRWGSVEDVQDMVDAAPGAVDPLYLDLPDRFDGYTHMVNNPQISLDFFGKYLG
ncbi:MAG: alpha/beta hydrolase [Acidimicrobiales bacterium]